MTSGKDLDVLANDKNNDVLTNLDVSTNVENSKSDENNKNGENKVKRFSKDNWRDCNLAIGVACNQDKIDSVFHWNVNALNKPKRYIELKADAHIKSASLNMLAREALKYNCDKIIFLDSDMLFPSYTISRLISHDLPVVSGLYHLKKYPFSPIAGWSDLKDGVLRRVNGRGNVWKKDYFPLPANQLVEVEWVGIGCLMVDVDVFRNIDFPCFYDVWNKLKGDRDVGHDILFCETVRNAGYKVFVDTSIDCSHRTMMNVNSLWIKSFYEAQMDKILQKNAESMKQLYR
jgi:hypothetical protein